MKSKMDNKKCQETTDEMSRMKLKQHFMIKVKLMRKNLTTSVSTQSEISTFFKMKNKNANVIYCPIGTYIVPYKQT